MIVKVSSEFTVPSGTSLGDMKPHAGLSNAFAENTIAASIVDSMYIAIRSLNERIVAELADPKEDPVYHETVLMMLQEDTHIMQGIMDNLVVEVRP